MSGKLTRPSPLGSRALLTRILDQPNLVAAIQALPAQALGRLIDHVGLEDSGEIVALATTEQLRRIFDDDLWRSERPGKDESFDAGRFALWLEVMLEAGEEFAAGKLAELPEDLVTLALQKHILVINVDELAIVMSNRQSDDDALTEKALESCLCEEIGEFRIISRRHDGWDAILSVLLALDRDHHDFLQRVLDRCCYVASEYIEENGGLCDVLTSEEMLESDAAGEREDRRTEEGFIAPSGAASFLASARATELAEIMRSKERDSVTRAYFRGLPTHTSAATAPSKADRDASSADSAGARGAARLVQLLRDAEVLPPFQPVALLQAQEAGASAETGDLFSQAVRWLREQATEAHARRMEELAFLANVLVAGCTIENRAFRPVEAARAAVAVCNLGLECLLEAKVGDGTAIDIVQSQGADKLFLAGWRLLFHDVVVPAAHSCQQLLVRSRARASDRSTGKESERAAAALRSALAGGKPWIARNKLGVLRDLIEPATLTALLSLMDECPHGSGKLCYGDGAEQPSADGEIRFLSTRQQLRSVKAFLSSTKRA